MAGDRTPTAPRRSSLTPVQQRNVERVETLIGAAAPLLDLLLAFGDRVSRIAEPREYEYYPVRAEELPRDQPRKATGD